MKQFNFKIFILFNLFLLQQANGNISNTLKCLANEELIIHQAKSNGPVYLLNQRLFNYFRSLSRIDIKDSYYAKICHHPNFSPSVSMLHLLLIEGKKIFHFPKLGKKYDTQRAVLDDAIHSLIEKSPHIFFNFLSKLQGLTGQANCLGKNIPHLNYFLDRFKYLEVDIPMQQLLEEKGKIEEIFTALKKYNKILHKCRRVMKPPQKKKSAVI